MNFSYWENTELVGNNDVVIIGSGITGLSAAIHIKRANSKRKVLVLERGMTPWGASSKNAGFACFGSLGEILDDVDGSSLEEVVELIHHRNKGLQTLIGLLGKDSFDYQQNGGFELFNPSQKEEYQKCMDNVDRFNGLLKNEFGGDVFQSVPNDFGFNNVIGIIKNNFEAQINTGEMMRTYLQIAKQEGIRIMNGAGVEAIQDNGKTVDLVLEGGMEIKTNHVIVCSNGFAKQFLDDDIDPARAQVLITKPINNLPFKGTFHYDKGYYYFRNIHDRVLFGGGRNLDFEGEKTTKMECSDLIMDELKSILSTVILPNTPHEVDYTWAGVMGVGTSKHPIVKNISTNVTCGVRLGGMGVALGTLVGKDCAEQYLAQQ